MTEYNATKQDVTFQKNVFFKNAFVFENEVIIFKHNAYIFNWLRAYLHEMCFKLNIYRMHDV